MKVKGKKGHGRPREQIFGGPEKGRESILENKGKKTRNHQEIGRAR